ncbi:MAG: amidase [Rudaea sp.]|uniref:amidase n=1 Tax=unclassified Rudaea TaxID=2627037 RepID=UPI0010F9800A|nr:MULTISPECIES: amidase [unclassified Rudaea]MBN8885970.1 amidase [Rudaea sp.]
MNVELDPAVALEPLPPLDAKRLRGANLCQTLTWLASSRVSATALTQTYLDAIAADNTKLNAYVALNPHALAEAQASEARRGSGKFGRFDGVPVAVKDNFDVAGLPTGCGMPGAHAPAEADAHVVARLRGAGAVILGKAQVPEASLAATSNNPHTGAAHNPFRHGYQAGGSSGGCAAAVAAGLAAVAIGSDSLGSIRIPASYCGLYALKPTHGEISTRGMLPAARRLDSVGLIARSVHDLGVMLHVLGGHDPADPRSRRRRVELALPDWEPGKLRVGLLGDLDAYAVEPGVKFTFERALMALAHELENRREVSFGDFPLMRARRAAFFMIEAEMLVTHARALADTAHPVSAELRAWLDYARGKSAADYAAADRLLDAAVVAARKLFEEVDVLVTPTTPQTAFPLEAPLPDNAGDFTCIANLAGLPAVTIPMGLTLDGLPVGMQFVGPPGSDLRLLELAEVCAAALDAAPAYPVGG